MNAPPALAMLAVLPSGENPGILENLSYQAAGLAVVILSLGLLAIVVGVIGRLLTRRPAAVKASAKPALAGESGIPPETIAVITAAVAVTLRKPHHILQIRPVNSPWLQAWSLEGRRQIFQSHNPR